MKFQVKLVDVGSSAVGKRPLQLETGAEAERRVVTLVFLGGLFMMSFSGGSTPRLWAGGPSMMMLIQRICIGFRGFGVCIRVDRVIRDRAAMLVLS